MKYKIYVSDGNTEMSTISSDLYETVTKVAELITKFPEYMISIRFIPEED